MKWKLNRDCFKIDFGFKHKIFLCFIFLFFYFFYGLFLFNFNLLFLFLYFAHFLYITDFLLDLFKLFSPIAFYTMINI